MRYLAIGLLGWGMWFAPGSCFAATDGIEAVPAKHRVTQSELMFLDVANAGDRLVAVGEQGVIQLSDDHGVTFRQATSVPVNSTLTAVSFADSEHGWAVGHWGVIITTSDGGENWTLERIDTSVDQPLFSVTFKNAEEGWAVGLWSLLLHTQDGGHTWLTEHLQPPPGSTKADRNLYKVFLGGGSTLFVAAEMGYVLRSTDGGKSWTYLVAGYTGSFWTGLVASNGTVFVGGLRGTLYRSTDAGAHWVALSSGTKASITGMSERAGHLIAVGLDGYVCDGPLDGLTLTSRQRRDRLPLTAVIVEHSGAAIVLSKSGILSKD
jgi:photosystem II stability/assembly factor-like uncharacterized protein